MGIGEGILSGEAKLLSEKEVHRAVQGLELEPT